MYHNKVSDCCHRSVTDGIQRHYPLGGKTWFESFKVDVCDCCGRVCETVEACGNCGIVGCMGVYCE